MPIVRWTASPRAVASPLALRPGLSPRAAIATSGRRTSRVDRQQLGLLATLPLVRDRRAGRRRERDHARLTEADLRTPAGEVGTGEVERIAELDQHVERHHQPEGVLAAGVVDQVLDRDERPAWPERLVRRADQVELLLEAPVVEDHAHR